MKLIYSSQFKKDYKKVKRQGKDLPHLEIVVTKLLNKKKLPTKYNNHKLSGRWESFRDFHNEPDWILIYQLTEDKLILERTGTHSELFR